MSDHVFSLIPQRPNCYYSSVMVDFSPPPNPNKPSNSIIPTFLNDRKFYTPSFVLPRSMEYFLNTHEFEKDKFEERILKENRLHNQLASGGETSEELTLPVPTSPFCQICKCPFSSYVSHISDPDHLKKSRLSKANSFIKDLCRKIKKENKWKETFSRKQKSSKKIEPEKKWAKSSASGKVRKEKKRENQIIKGVLNFSTHAPSAVPTPIQ